MKHEFPLDGVAIPRTGTVAHALFLTLERLERVGWCQLGRDGSRECPILALDMVVRGNPFIRFDAGEALWRATGEQKYWPNRSTLSNFFRWNDASERTWEQVRAVIIRAIEMSMTNEQ